MLYRYSLYPLSPVMTPLMSDTFFGHLCWALVYKKGEKYLENFLDLYNEEKTAPVLFSSAFVSGYLPRPVLPLPKRKEIREFVDEKFVSCEDKSFNNLNAKQKRFKGMGSVKAWNMIRFIEEKDWLLLKDSYYEVLLYDIFYKKFIVGHTSQAGVMKNEISASNTVNRISGTVDEKTGGLFQREKQWYHENTKLDLYVKTQSQEFASLADWFLTEHLPVYGFGKDKTVGMGYLKICKDESFKPDIFNVSNANAAVTLSLTAFDKIMEYPSYYRLMAKFGKLGGSYAFSSPTGGKTRPFKKPIMMMEPGSIFFTSERLNNKPLLKDVHSDKNIRHAGVPLTLPLKTREDYA
jgi:CRISPR-associated protein Csm4